MDEARPEVEPRVDTGNKWKREEAHTQGKDLRPELPPVKGYRRTLSHPPSVEITLERTDFLQKEERSMNYLIKEYELSNKQNDILKSVPH